MYNNDFYENLDLKYPEIAIDKSTKKVKCAYKIPILTPFVKDIEAEPYQTKNTGKPIKNKLNKLKNKDSLPLTKVNRQNFVRLYALGGVTPVEPGGKYIIIFIGGDINKIRIIGRY